MNASGETADQVVRMSLQGIEVVVVEKDRDKTEDSARSLPLIQPVEDSL